MSLTRAQAESILVRRTGKVLAYVMLDGTTANGTNATLAGPIAYAVRQCGGTVADPTNPTDVDLAAVADADVDKFLDVAELRALEDGQGNNDLVSLSAGGVGGGSKDSISDFGSRLDKLIERKRKQVEKEYGIGLGAATAGTIDLGFAEQMAVWTWTEGT